MQPQSDPEAGAYRNDEATGASDAVSETASERYQRKRRLAASVWFSGFFSGYNFLHPPQRLGLAALDEETQEELMTKETYEVPRGYKYYDEDLPGIIKPHPTGKYLVSLVMYTILTSIATVFLLAAACPIPWYRGKNVTVAGVNFKGVQFTLWKQKGGSLPEVPVADLWVCRLQKQFYQSIAASTIIACIFAFLSLGLAIKRLVKGSGGYGWILLLGFLSFAWALTANGMAISQFHLSRCTEPRLSSIASLDAGFALSLIAWIFELVAVLVLAVVTQLNVGPALKDVRVMDSLYLLLLLVALLFAVVGNAGTVWKRHFGTPEVRVVRVTYWHTELITGDGTSLYFGRASYRCSAYTKRMKASISFLILGSIMLFFATVFGVGAFVKRGFRVASCVFTIIASIFLFISWVTVVAVFYRTCCTSSTQGTTYVSYPGVPSGVEEGHLKFTGYGVQEGVVLVIIAWILCTLGVVLNFLSPWPALKNRFSSL